MALEAEVSGAGNAAANVRSPQSLISAHNAPISIIQVPLALPSTKTCGSHQCARNTQYAILNVVLSTNGDDGEVGILSI